MQIRPEINFFLKKGKPKKINRDKERRQIKRENLSRQGRIQQLGCVEGGGGQIRNCCFLM